jgi:hypothetical protein
MAISISVITFGIEKRADSRQLFTDFETAPLIKISFENINVNVINCRKKMFLRRNL